jgi:hypothetical protein
MLWGKGKDHGKTTAATNFTNQHEANATAVTAKDAKDAKGTRCDLGISRTSA